jgi:Zn-dependent M28 family amino/carboxypeptidase
MTQQISVAARLRGPMIVGAPLIVIFAAAHYMVRMPGTSFSGTAPQLSFTELRLKVALEQHVKAISTDLGPRNHRHEENYKKAAAYISTAFEQSGYSVQNTKDDARPKRGPSNIEVRIEGVSAPSEVIVIGAHYDTSGQSPGADDNASGVAVLLELAKLLKSSSPARTLIFVAFADEEPPHFKQNTMGSLSYARALAKTKVKVVAMISIETVGHFSDAPGSQHYPFPYNILYPSTGNFLSFVGDLSSRALVQRCIESFRREGTLPSEGLAAPRSAPGVSWSDHWSFWQIGAPALMVTDTGSFRSDHYHTKTDTAEKLDTTRMVRVVTGLETVIRDLSQADADRP